MPVQMIQYVEYDHFLVFAEHFAFDRKVECGGRCVFRIRDPWLRVGMQDALGVGLEGQLQIHLEANR